MKSYIVLILLAVFFCGQSVAACLRYSLPAHCLVVVRGERAIPADRVDIVATVESNGRPCPPFSIIMYDKTGKQLDYATVFGGHYSTTNDVRNIMIANVSDRVVVQNEITIADDHFRLSAKKEEGGFKVVVDDLDMLRLFGKAEEETNRFVADLFLGAKGTERFRLRPKDDHNRIFRCSCEKDVSSDLGHLILKGNLYQNGNTFSIYFELARKTGGGGALARGRLVGKVLDDRILDRVVTYEVGDGSIEVDVDLLKGDAKNVGDVSDEMLKQAMKMSQAKFDKHVIRLSLSYQAIKMFLDIRMEDGHSVRDK